MGIPGFTTFINANSKRYIKPYELRDTYVVIDGYNISSHIYKWHMRSISAFGGDYDLFARVTREFFLNLRKCNVVPIVIFDGGYEKKKLKTIRKRINDKMLMLMNFNRTFWTGVFFPLLLHEVFVSVLHELDITCVQCFFEADKEIAAVARHLNCPVLSYDSDFFIFDVLYIPFNTVDSKVQVSENGCYLSCSIYDVNVFLEEFQGFDKASLPLLPALLGNDYVDRRVFDKFFNHVGISHNLSSNYAKRKIYGLLQWLRNETLDTAVERILSHIEKKYFDSAMKAIKETIDDYKRSEPLILPLLRLESNEGIPKPLIYVNHELIKRLPERFIQLYQNAKIMGPFIDMINLNRYYVKIQVEDVTHPSSQMISIPIISAIHKILDAFTGVQSSVTLYIKQLKHYTKIALDYTVDDCFNGVEIENIIGEPREVKINVIYKVLSLNNNDKEVIKNFDSNWILLIICLIFWFKNSKTSSVHSHSIFLMMIANYAQTKIGYYKNYGRLMRSKAGEINRLSKSEIPTVNPEGMKFSSLLGSITELEILLISQKFIKLRQHEPEVTSRGYFISTIHSFASFQSVLLHVSELNGLMDFPFPPIKIQEFYCGTLLYNLYFFLNKKQNLSRFLNDMLRDVPNVKIVYDYLEKKLSSYTMQTTSPEKPKRLGHRSWKRN